jgi:hypothetical protein
VRAGEAATFWQRHVDGWRASGLTQKQYGRRHGVSAQSLAQWSCRLKRSATSGAKQALVPIRVIGDTALPMVHLQHGAWRLAVPVGTDPCWLAALIRETAAC